MEAEPFLAWTHFLPVITFVFVLIVHADLWPRMALVENKAYNIKRQ